MTHATTEAPAQRIVDRDAQAASRHYFRVDAAQLGPNQAARLAVMLPAPKRFEKNPASAYVAGRSATVAARMSAVELP